MKQMHLLILVLMMGLGFTASAQTKPAAKFKPLPLTTVIGGYKDSATITVAEAERTIAEKIYIVDTKKVPYTISSYQLAYRKLGVTEDEQTGKVSPTYTLVASLFKTTPLPANWIQQIREQVKAGDELWFFDIIAKDAQGRVMYAPDIKLRVK
ncbi:MAG: hypothetical protein EOO06_14320 [Chitinophagaceae bacterium]|nr:MAG: hypothetical protein EOO06_14320 [Chitinophagaceae bacterium]